MNVYWKRGRSGNFVIPFQSELREEWVKIEESA